jgi:hypothetical protein
MKDYSVKVQFVTCNRVKDYYGITSGLYNSAKFVADYLATQGYETKLESVVDSNSIDRVVTEFDPDIVIIEALWVPPAKFQELLKIKRHKKRRWIVRIHSKAPFLANEGLATEWISEYTKIKNPHIEIAPNTVELTRQLHSAFPHGKFIYLPNIYVFKKVETEKLPKPNEEDKWIEIGSFGAIRPMKNTYQQALAAIEFAESKGMRLKFHVNGSRIEQMGGNVLKNIRALFEESPHRLVEHYWYKHNDFLKVISKMDLGMQVSFSESFNIVTADFVNMNVPIVASDDITWMPRLLKASPTSHKQMVRKLKVAHALRGFSAWLQRIHLKVYNFRAKSIWLASFR